MIEYSRSECKEHRSVKTSAPVCIVCLSEENNRLRLALKAILDAPGGGPAIRNSENLAENLAKERKMEKAKIDKMVDRFLGWKLPKNFNPDAGISFKPEYNVEYMAKQGKPPMRYEPTGTNLFDADQAREMIEYMLGLE